MKPSTYQSSNIHWFEQKCTSNRIKNVKLYSTWFILMHWMWKIKQIIPNLEMYSGLVRS